MAVEPNVLEETSVQLMPSREYMMAPRLWTATKLPAP
jgi:hypothetical protein